MANDPTKRISIKKIGGGIIKANMKFWGGDKVPILNSLVNFDSAKFMDQFKVDASTKQQLKKAGDNISKLTGVVAAEEQKLGQHKMALITIINSLDTLRNTVMMTTPDAFNSSQAYKINQQLVQKLNMAGTINIVTYNGLKANVVTRDLEAAYKKAADGARKTEQQLMLQMSKLNKSCADLKRNQRISNDIVKNYKK